jgi:aminoglycoside phosphotransferase family enzyme/predicted kinase
MDVTIADGPVAARSETQALVDKLRDPACYPHPVRDVEVVETHISFVLLAGDYAYKIKKPVHFPFADFSTLAARRFYCAEEMRLNSRTAPGLYVGVVPITGEGPSLRVGGKGPVREYAVRMWRFGPGALLSDRARERLVTPEQVDTLATTVACLHAEAECAAPASPFGTPETIATALLESLGELAAIEPSLEVRETLNALRDWARTQHQLLFSRFARRKSDGFVRECHGDLHLGNVALVDDAPVPFDALEFNERLRWCDVASDAAFVAMDLLHHGLPRLAWRFLTGYFERTGDYGALPLLRYYMVYRALVRAKVAALRAAQPWGAPRGASPVRPGCVPGVLEYLATASAIARRGSPLLVVMQGFSGSGKTTVSERLAEALGGIRLRSDVERKRLGLGHNAAANARLYTHLARMAQDSLAAGWTTLIDAAFLERKRRDQFRDVARDAGAAFEIVRCDCPADVLRARVDRRQREEHDASDADVAVLDWQIAHAEPLAPEERLHSMSIDTTHPGEWQGAVENLARRFRIVAP